MIAFEITDINNIRYFPAKIYKSDYPEDKNELLEVNDIRDFLHKYDMVYIISKKLDSDGNELGIFQGFIKSTDIKRIVTTDYFPETVNLDLVMTLSEAAEKWELADGSSIRKAIERGRFKSSEIKLCGKVWIITYSAMQRVFGAIPEKNIDYTISYTDFSNALIMAESYALEIQKNKHQKDGAKLEFLRKRYEEFKLYLSDIIDCLDRGGKVIIKHNFKTGASNIYTVFKSHGDLIEWSNRLREGIHIGYIIGDLINEIRNKKG